ncbi:hypothetical protein [Kitasatospora sp. NPDC015120]|uniref:hypothetical protein n=1 Tax=Kitasatospora sp. NPDC015120 TaxID=3364023 RepID=UPI0036F4AC9F
MPVHPYRLAGEPVEIKAAENGEDLREFRAWWTAHANAGTLIGFDTETTGLAWTDRIRLAQFADANTAYVIPVELGWPFREAAIEALAALPNLVAPNLAFDALKVDNELGIRLEDLYPRAQGSRVAAHLLDSRHDYEGGAGLSLKPLSAWYVDPAAPDTQNDLTKVFNGLGLTKENGWARIELSHHVYELYAGLDALLVARLLPKLLERYRAEGLPGAAALRTPPRPGVRQAPAHRNADRPRVHRGPGRPARPGEGAVLRRGRALRRRLGEQPRPGGRRPARDGREADGEDRQRRPVGRQGGPAADGRP